MKEKESESCHLTWLATNIFLKGLLLST